MSSRVLVIDNYDSFVYILVQYLGELGLEPIVFRNDKLSLQDVSGLDADAILISPGPGTPRESGISMELIREFKELKPIFGVCLGLQCIGEFFGGNVVRAPKVMHGKTSAISHTNHGVFSGISNPVEATRYHSLIVEKPYSTVLYPQYYSSHCMQCFKRIVDNNRRSCTGCQQVIILTLYSYNFRHKIYKYVQSVFMLDSTKTSFSDPNHIFT